MRIIKLVLATIILQLAVTTVIAQSKYAVSEKEFNYRPIANDSDALAHGILGYDPGERKRTMLSGKKVLYDKANPNANYQKGYELFKAGNTDDAIPYLEKSLAIKPTAAAYDALGAVYDQKDNFEKAEYYYLKGITAFPKNSRLHYNLSICYNYNKGPKHVKAESEAITAIKLDPKQAKNYEVYCNYDLYNSSGNTSFIKFLMSYCSMLLVENNGEWSPDSFSNMTMRFDDYAREFKYAEREKADRKAKGIKDGKPIIIGWLANKDPDIIKLNTIFYRVAAAGSLDTTKTKTPVELLNGELTDIFIQSAKVSAHKKHKDFFWRHFVDYFGALAASGNMTAFTHYITLIKFKDGDTAWMNAHPKEMKKFKNWVTTTPRAMN